MPSLAVAFIAIIGVWIYVLVALVCHEFCNNLGEGLDLCRHCVELGVLCLCVGCMVVVGRCRSCYLGKVVTDFVTIGRLVLVLASGTTTCVLLVCVGPFHQRLKVLFGEYIAGFDGGGLSLTIKHSVHAKVVAVVHLLQVKLEFVLFQDCYVGLDEHSLVVVEALPKGGEMFVTIPLDVVPIFQCFPCFDVKGAPTVVQMFQDLEGSEATVHWEALHQL